MELFLKTGVSKTANRMRQICSYIQKHITKYDPTDVLCAFDIDMTILQPDHPASYVPNVHKYLNIYHTIQEQYPKMDTSLPFLYTFLLPQHIVDNDIYEILKKLKTKKIAFTATLTGTFLNYPRLEILRYQQLKEKNISFENTFEIQDLVLDNCPSYRGYYPAFYKGILFSNSEKGMTTKGTVLCAFLKKIDWSPKCIILVDDRLRNLLDVKNELEKDFPQIEFIGIEYTGARNYCPKDISEKDFKAFWSDCFEKAYHLPQ